MYTIKTVRGKLLPAWMRETLKEVENDIAFDFDDSWYKNGMAKRRSETETYIDIVKVKLVEV